MSEKEIPEGYKVLSEGQAKILYRAPSAGEKRQKDDAESTRDAVFYNPVQEFNRDISILAITQFGRMLKAEKEEKKEEFEGLKVLEALAATGLRSVRYCKEIGVRANVPEIKVAKIVANDWDREASATIEKNFKFNDLDTEVEVTTMDGQDLMYDKRR